MSMKMKQLIIAVLGGLFLVSLIFVQAMELIRKKEEAGLRSPHIAVPASSRRCVDCHKQSTPGIIDHWIGSTHAEKGVGCVECHRAAKEDADHFEHYGATIATIVTPLDCSRCHQKEYKEFTNSHHASAGNILASLDNFLAETVEGSRKPFNPHSPTPGKSIDKVNGMASVNTGCKQCHGSEVALIGTDGSKITFRELKPNTDDPEKLGQPTNLDAVAKVMRSDKGMPKLDHQSWPNTGIGRLNLDGSRGSCSACHSRHDFSPRRARRPENCGKCHLGPDHPQKEIYEESKHGVAYRDLKEKMNLDAKHWVLGKDYTQAPTCATCHMSGNTQNGGRVTHDPGERISWTNRPPISAVMDTDLHGAVVKETDPETRKTMVHDSWQNKRGRMRQVCTHCHAGPYVDAFYKQYDDFVVNYNEKFAKPGKKIIDSLKAGELITKANFDEKIEWTWFYLWHHEGRRARHGASMMAPDYAHWHGMYEVAERFYQELIPEARELIEHGRSEGKGAAADATEKLIEEILDRPEHEWFEAAKKERAAKAAADAVSADKKPSETAHGGAVSDGSDNTASASDDTVPDDTATDAKVPDDTTPDDSSDP